MKKKYNLLIVLLAISLVQCSSQNNAPAYQGGKFQSPDSGTDKRVTATIIYDNYVHKDGLVADWGYSLLLEGLDKTILFDTGTNPEIFEGNFKKLNIDAGGIDEVFISHEHGDHFGGLHKFLSLNNSVKVVVPETFSRRFVDDYSDECNAVEVVSAPVEICNGLYSSGVLGISIPEQALILNTGKGLVVMTGCSHPGIINMLTEIKEIFSKDIYLVFGGFHLMEATDKEIGSIISDMQDLGVQKCGATHCTGEHQIELFREAFGKDFVEMGAGNVILLSDLSELE